MFLKASVWFLQFLGVAILYSAIVWDKWYSAPFCKPQAVGLGSRNAYYKLCGWDKPHREEGPGFAIPLFLWTFFLVVLDLALYICSDRDLPTFLFPITSCLSVASTFLWWYRKTRLPCVWCSNAVVVYACVFFLLAGCVSFCENSLRRRKPRPQNKRRHLLFLTSGWNL